MTKILEIAAFMLVSTLLLAASAFSQTQNNLPDLNWLTVSDKAELDRTWQQSLVYLPKKYGRQSVKLLNVPGKLDKIIQSRPESVTQPTILFLHSCEGFGEHREDMRRLAKLGFVVIAPDSFSREYRPLGCYEDRSKFIPSFSLAVAFQKAELDYAIQKLAAFSWIDRKNLFLFGSGMGGLVAAQYAGGVFSGHVIEGWGCLGPNPVYDGIWAPENVRIYTTISRNDPFFLNNPGFGNDCSRFTINRPDSVSVVLDRPAHFVSWYPGSIGPLIRFLMRDIDVDIEALVLDNPEVLQNSPDKITLRQKWSDEVVYKAAVEYCAGSLRKSHLVAEPIDEVYEFICE